MSYEYEKDGSKIYDKSFAIIRNESHLANFKNGEEKVVVRMIHASGMTNITNQVYFSKNMVNIARNALQNGANILCDTNMVKYGITNSRLPANNKIICMLGNEQINSTAKKIKNTRTAAGVELWKPYLSGAIVAIGNAPTALFYLLDMLKEDNCPKPSAIIGFPVGFVGAQESKEALYKFNSIPFCIIKGRLGGSAMTVAAINAIAKEKE
tara:strand:+ start:2018 stop:2647 length:630 start_codon:yes stop_codon:yes gene_type:complete